MKEDSVLENDESKSLLSDPLKVARIALHRMIIECGWKQEDRKVKWDHIGLLPSEIKNGWTLQPVMLDLARVSKIPNDENREEIFQNHLKILKDLIPKKKSNEQKLNAQRERYIKDLQ
ncbi:hypothetical protein MP638_003988 [Amoeboaphelidium occidentale]|nr:hypothetical protein MP638_003988 [Amoeboaphelidium occidentale]